MGKSKNKKSKTSNPEPNNQPDNQSNTNSGNQSDSQPSTQAINHSNKQSNKQSTKQPTNQPDLPTKPSPITVSASTADLYYIVSDDATQQTFKQAAKEDIEQSIKQSIQQTINQSNVNEIKAELASLVAKVPSVDRKQIAQAINQAINELEQQSLKSFSTSFSQLNEKLDQTVKQSNNQATKAHKKIRAKLSDTRNMINTRYIANTDSHVHLSKLRDDVMYQTKKMEYIDLTTSVKKFTKTIKDGEKSLKNFGKLRILKWGHNCPDPYTAQTLVGELHYLESLEYLDFTTCMVAAFPGKFRDFLWNMPQLTYLNLSHAAFNPRTADWLAEGLMGDDEWPGTPNLTYLDLSGNQLLTNGLSRMTKALSTLTELRYLYITEAGLDAQAGKEIAKFMYSMPHLCQVAFSDNPLGDVGVTAIANVLPNMKRLQSLQFEQCQISDKGFKTLWTSLSGQRWMTEFNVIRNQVSRPEFDRARNALGDWVVSDHARGPF